MAVAAYASLVSLTHVIDNIHYRAHLHRLRLDIKQVERLQDNVYFLLDFVEVHSKSENQGMGHLWRQMAEVAYEAEEVIDLHVVDELYHGSQECKSVAGILSFHQDMERVIQKTDNIKTELSIVKEEVEDVCTIKPPRVPRPVDSSKTLYSSSKNIMVGFDEHVARILDELTNNECNLQIIPIVGMGGIGKTTLAKNVFTHPFVVPHFDICDWVTISQEYSVQQILTRLLSEGKEEECGENLSGLGENLYHKLYNRRYFIVMDDVWSTDAWDDIKMFFPNNRNRSRVMITTRLSNVVVSLGCQNLCSLSFLNEDQSWDLFCQKTFSQECCPYPELEDIGKDITKSCRGLPLAIVVIASLLVKSNKTREYWEFVAKNVNSFGNLEDDEHCLKILSLSYTNLPMHLKPCFLHMRVFREDDVIDVSNVIELWVGEGFIESTNDKSLEEIAQEYFEDLISRNLIFVQKWTISREIEKCGIHDLLRDLCLKESSRENFIRTRVVQRISYWKKKFCSLCSDLLQAMESDVVNYSDLILVSPSMSRAKVPVCDACKITYSNVMKIRPVKAIDLICIRIHKEFVQPTQLRYISLQLGVAALEFVSPSAFHLLWNLHTIKIDAFLPFPSPVVPSEFWEMPQLRHFEVKKAVLNDPLADPDEDFMILKNLHTLSNICGFTCTKKVLDRIPNLKTLQVCYDYESNLDEDIEGPKHFLCNLGQLGKLESLEIENALEKDITFSKSLKKLVLWHYHISWEDLSIIGSLPSLEILELINVGEGLEWNPFEGEFLQLKGLRISFSDLECWRANSVHFPKLEWLVLSYLKSLVEIPLGIGDIMTLHTIKVEYCSNTIVESAKQIWEEQQSIGNDGLQIHVIDEDWREYQIGNFASMRIQEDGSDDDS